jgi:hypothetical protein
MRMSILLLSSAIMSFLENLNLYHTLGIVGCLESEYKSARVNLSCKVGFYEYAYIILVHINRRMIIPTIVESIGML